MKRSDAFLLIAYAVCLSFGQILFKYSAKNLTDRPCGISCLVDRLANSASFWFAVTIYGLLTLFWVWILSRVSLVTAYPFVALCFVLVPAMSWVAFGERVGGAYVLGTILILAGLGLIFMEVGK